MRFWKQEKRNNLTVVFMNSLFEAVIARHEAIWNV